MLTENGVGDVCLEKPPGLVTATRTTHYNKLFHAIRLQDVRSQRRKEELRKDVERMEMGWETS